VLEEAGKDLSKKYRTREMSIFLNCAGRFMVDPEIVECG